MRVSKKYARIKALGKTRYKINQAISETALNAKRAQLHQLKQHFESSIESNILDGEDFDPIPTLNHDGEHFYPIQTINHDPIQTINHDPIQTINHDPIQTMNHDDEHFDPIPILNRELSTAEVNGWATFFPEDDLLPAVDFSMMADSASFITLNFE